MEKFVVLKNEKIKVGNIKKQKINISMKKKTLGQGPTLTSGKPLKQKDIKEIVQQLSDKFKREKDEDAKILVRGMNELGVWTLKGYDESIDEMFEDEEEYLSGRVKDSGKFQHFQQIEICLYS